MRENEKQTAMRDRYENLVSHCPRRALSRQHAGDYEQRLQEQPTCVVRSDVQRKAPHKHWAQLTAAIKAAIIDFDQTAGLAGWAKVVLFGGLSDSAPMVAPLLGYFFCMITMLTTVVVVLTGFSNISTSKRVPISVRL